MDKSEDALKTVSDVKELLGVQPHVLRYWESQFTQVKPLKRAGGRRYYRPEDVRLLAGIQTLLHDEGLTIKGVRKVLDSKGVGHVANLAGQAGDAVKSEARGPRSVDAGTRASGDAVPANSRAAQDAAPGASDVPAPTLADPVRQVNGEAAAERQALISVYEKLKSLRARMAADPG